MHHVTNGGFITNFISQEQGTSSAYLFGKLTAVTNGSSTAGIPEPAPIAAIFFHPQ